MAIGHQEIYLRGSTCPDVFEQADPAVFALLGTGPQCQHLFVASHVHSQRCQDDRRIGLVPMAHTEMDPIQVEDAPVLLQPSFTPGSELLLEIAVEATDGTRAGSHSH
jgi:hypothetical protein